MFKKISIVFVKKNFSIVSTRHARRIRTKPFNIRLVWCGFCIKMFKDQTNPNNKKSIISSCNKSNQNQFKFQINR